MIYWLKDGDLNTKFFHNSASARRKRKIITRPKGDDGIWVKYQSNLGRLIGNYFTNLFTTSKNEVEGNWFFGAVFKRITVEQNDELVRDFSMNELKKAIKQMHIDKLSGLNGFNPAFYQHCWPTVGEDIFREAKHWLDQESLTTGINNTNVVLIPNSDNPQTIKDLRAISLCNVFYMIL